MLYHVLIYVNVTDVMPIKKNTEPILAALSVNAGVISPIFRFLY